MMTVLLAAAAMMPSPIPQDASKIYKNALPSIMTLQVDTDEGVVTGTAFLIGKNGLAVTAYHVIDGARSARAYFADGKQYEVEGLIDADPGRDVAMLRIKNANRPFLSYVNAHPEVGAKAYTIGAPEGLDFSISDGIISQIRRLDSFVQYQYTCPTSHGNSGGPLLDAQGRVLGVVLSVVKDAQNLNFAACWAYPKALNATLPLQKFSRSSGGGSKPAKGDPVETELSPKEEAADLIFLMQFAQMKTFFDVADLVKIIVEETDKEKFRVPKSTLEAIEDHTTMIELAESLDTPDASVNRELKNVAKALKARQEGIVGLTKLFDYLRVYGWDDWAEEKYDDAWRKFSTRVPWESINERVAPWWTESVSDKYSDDLLTIAAFGYVPQVLRDIGFFLDIRDYQASRVGWISSDSIAEEAEFKFGDTIADVDGREFDTWAGLTSYLEKKRGTTVTFHMRRGGRMESIRVRIPEED